MLLLLLLLPKSWVKISRYSTVIEHLKYSLQIVSKFLYNYALLVSNR